VYAFDKKIRSDRIKKHELMIIAVMIYLVLAQVALATPKGDIPDFLSGRYIIGYDLKDKFASDLDGDSKKETVQLLQKPTDDTFALFIIRIHKNNKVFDLDPPILAPKDFCYMEKLVISPEHNPLIKVAYPVGAHSEWLGLYSFDGQSIVEVNNLFSDKPDVQFEDFNNDGILDLKILNRDYNKNPVSDSYTEKFKYKDGKFKKVRDY
jgi:hypothetical protein